MKLKEKGIAWNRVRHYYVHHNIYWVVAAEQTCMQ